MEKELTRQVEAITELWDQGWTYMMIAQAFGKKSPDWARRKLGFVK